MIKSLLLGTACLFACPASAETLAEAVKAAYATNPVLAAAVARHDARVETIEQARSDGRLAASVDAAAGYDRFDYGKGGSATVNAELPIWTGGRVPSAVQVARNEVSADEEGVRDTQAAVLEAVVGAYADLLYDQQAIDIVNADITLLDNQVAEARARFKLGTSTRTDVARLEAQRASAEATRANTQAALLTDTAAYQATVGREPEALTAPRQTLAALPGSLDQARARALANNPVYRQSQHSADAYAARISTARANGAPRLALGGSYGYAERFAGLGDRGYNNAATGGLVLHIPILTGGLVSSQVRQARSDYRAAQFDTEAAGREAVRSADAAWAAFVSAQSQTMANAEGVTAANTALNGIRAEYAFGLRSTLDILVADESLRGAQLALARNRSDMLIAQAALLRATGGLGRSTFE
jgi:outer membrane protein